MKKVLIPEKMQRFYGTGTMLHPDRGMIESIIKEIPAGRIATIDTLCKRLAHDNGTSVTCPMRTTNFVKTIAEVQSQNPKPIPFWRVVRKDFRLINSPHAALCTKNLEKEGFKVTQNSKGEFKVQNPKDKLFTFL